MSALVASMLGAHRGQPAREGRDGQHPEVERPHSWLTRRSLAMVPVISPIARGAILSDGSRRRFPPVAWSSRRPETACGSPVGVPVVDSQLYPGKIEAMEQERTFAAFAGVRRVASGRLLDVLPVLKQRFDKDDSDSVLVFEVETGRQVDFDLRGSLDEVLERAGPPQPRGPGRPRLGVTSREVSLMPRHWDWLEQQPSGISAALRRLVENAIKDQPGKERARRIRAALSGFLSSMAGDRPNYEEACRALFAGDSDRFERLVCRWPKDIRDYAVRQARDADHAEAGP